MSIFPTYKEVEKIDMESLMDMIETQVLREPTDVDRRLSELGLARKGLLKARDVAIPGRRKCDATSLCECGWDISLPAWDVGAS